MDVLIEVEHDVEDGTGAQRTRVVSGARSNLSQMLLQRVLMDVERVGCAGDGPSCSKKHSKVCTASASSSGV